MALPNLQIQIKADIYYIEENGDLIFQYRPLQNLKLSMPDAENVDIGDLNLSTSEAEIDPIPLDLSVETSYDDSVNLIVNDRKNLPKIVNSRFYLDSSTTYKIADRRGNVDSNLYTKESFPIETSLTKVVRSIVNLEFKGVFSGGRLPIGNYTFYFKLADDDGNESDFISESSRVVCYIGDINNPKSIRGGQLDENSDKLVTFKLNNLDLSYSYITVYYTRSTGDDTIETIKSYRINDKFKVSGESQEITITGFENTEEIDNSELNIQYANFDSSKTIENCQNITFAGNITKDYDVFKTLENYSLHVTPRLYTGEEIGNVGNDYLDNNTKNPYEYYNPDNIYYRLGLWNEEIYRVGIVYILNNYTLSPVFDIRGIKELTTTPSFKSFVEDDGTILNINVGEDFSIINSDTGKENSKGVFKIVHNGSIFSGSNSIKPIGLTFNIPEEVKTELKKYVRGFFMVRQKRIPTILAQGVSIGTANKSNTPTLKTNTGYFSESFVTPKSGIPILGRNVFSITESVLNNAMLCPEASLRPYLFNNFFNSSEFTLKKAPVSSNSFVTNLSVSSNNLYSLEGLTSAPISSEYKKANLLLVEPGTELIGNKTKFSSKAGNPLEPWKTKDPNKGDINDLVDLLDNGSESWSNSTSVIRGEFNSYIGIDGSTLNGFGEYYNIFLKNYDFENNWRNYFKVRYNDFSSYSPISDRYLIDDFSKCTAYRGDCYINTYTHRMMWNFIDPELPTNTKVVDPYTWYKNYKVKQLKFKSQNGIVSGIQDESLNGTALVGDLNYNKILEAFTYKVGNLDTSESNWVDDDPMNNNLKILVPEDRKYKKYSESNGIFGAHKINRPDVNAIPIGHWVTFKVCSNVNLGLRDIDFKNIEEEAIHRSKRSFYPLQSVQSSSKLPESRILNQGISRTLGDKYYFNIPETPFIKTDFTNRIYYSELLQKSSFINGNREFKGQNYQDYTREHGALVKLMEWYGTLIAVMEHGVLMIPVNERAMMANAQGENVYINTENVLPKNPKVLSNMFGSLFPEAIVKTPRFIYGLDTVGKKIWRTNGQTFELISDMKIQKFLNDNITLTKLDRDNFSSSYIVKSHYNAFKHDVMFTFLYGNDYWNLCWNEILEKWCTRYSWFPAYSENINNIFYTFANESIHQNNGEYLYKHGFAGDSSEVGTIESTKWYDTQYPFEFEFIVIGEPGIQKIFDNLKVISNSTTPHSFYYEIIGDSFDWSQNKDRVLLIGNLSYTGSVDGISMPARGGGESDSDYLKRRYKTYLLGNTSIKKLPLIWIRELDAANWPVDSGDLNNPTKRDITLEQNNKTKEIVISSYQKGLDLKSVGRLKGNMHYVEDFWDVQIQPIAFTYCYLKNGDLTISNIFEMKIRDKYIKIRVKYDGTEYAIINAIKNLYTLSHA